MSKDYHYPLPRDDARTVTRAIAKIRNAQNEHLYIFKRGKQFRRFEGETDRVTISEEYLFELKDAVVVHNHPKGLSFSKEDVQAVVRYNAKELILATENFIYFLERPKDGWGIDFENDETHDLFESCRSLTEDMADKLIATNEMAVYEKDVIIIHYIWVLFFKMNNIKYVRKEHI